MRCNQCIKALQKLLFKITDKINLRSNCWNFFYSFHKLISRFFCDTVAPNNRDLRSAYGRSRCGSKSRRACGATAGFCKYVEIYRGIYVNLMFAAGDLHKSSCPINFQVNPDRADAFLITTPTSHLSPASCPNSSWLAPATLHPSTTPVVHTPCTNKLFPTCSASCADNHCRRNYYPAVPE